MPVILETLTQGIALVATVLGATGFYLGLARQQFLARPLSGARSRVQAMGLLLLAWCCWMATQRPATACFTLLTVSMISFILLPVVAALWRSAAEARSSDV
ncbi:hypothetical protein [Thiorhodococcus fuscus]|uniref:Cation:proton antiporter n=1 Tax=Thiorhodococcus fuscus TaxID=527200 RepID=A0ABW4Y6Z1_9GAMM